MSKWNIEIMAKKPKRFCHDDVTTVAPTSQLKAFKNVNKGWKSTRRLPVCSWPLTSYSTASHPKLTDVCAAKCESKRERKDRNPRTSPMEKNRYDVMRRIFQVDLSHTTKRLWINQHPSISEPHGGFLPVEQDRQRSVCLSLSGAHLLTPITCHTVESRRG